MKLRTTYNSIRIRIRKSELRLLEEYHEIEENIYFPTGIVFKFVLKIERALDTLEADLYNNVLTLSIPLEEGEKWMTTSQVGISTEIPVSTGKPLHLLIEKDFPCLDRENEDKSDTFQELVPEKPTVC